MGHNPAFSRAISTQLKLLIILMRSIFAWQENYRLAPSNGQPWLDGDRNYHPLRGGSWSNPPRTCRSAARCPMSGFYRDRAIGCRVALSQILDRV